jgi:hypothetical protein
VELEAKLFGTDVATLTGRLRGGVSFTQSCNTPFSGLAADGAKLGLCGVWCGLFGILCVFFFFFDLLLLLFPKYVAP